MEPITFALGRREKEHWRSLQPPPPRHTDGTPLSERELAEHYAKAKEEMLAASTQRCEWLEREMALRDKLRRFEQVWMRSADEPRRHWRVFRLAKQLAGRASHCWSDIAHRSYRRKTEKRTQKCGS